MALDTKQSGAGGGEWHIITPEEEIRALEAKLAEKKREHAAAGGAPESVPSKGEKEMFREVMGEHIAQSRPTAVVTPTDDTSTAPMPSAGGASSAAADDDATAAAVAREQKLTALVEHALTHTIEAAVARAEKETPYLIDELHDRLADKYYEKLIQLRKLEAL